MDQKIEKFRGILNELVNEILDIGSSFNIAILTASDELDENYEDGCYYTQVIIHEDFTATVNQYKKGDEELPPDEEFPDFDKDLIPESKCWNLPKREVLAHLAAIISPWIEDYLSKMKNGIDTLVKINVTCPTAIESLALLSLIYDKGKSVSTEFKQHKDPKSFVGDFEGYLSAYCDIDKIGARFEELQVRMGFETVKPAKTGQETKENIFRKEGDKWIVVFNHSEPCYLNDIKGMEQIAQLLAKSPKSISAIELANPKSDTKLMTLSNSDKPQEIIDKNALQSCQIRLREIEDELAGAEKNNDLAEQNKLKAEKEQILSYVQSTTKPSGQSGSFSDNIKNARDAVSSNINRALEKIKQNNPTLHQHLNNSIQRGTHFAYNPDRKIDWEL